MKRALCFISIATVIFICCANTGCGSGGTKFERSSDSSYSGDAIYAMKEEEEVTVNTEQAQPVEVEAESKKIIKTGRMGLDVDDIVAAKAGIDGMVARGGGYYSSENFHESDRTSTYTLSVRIPSANYETFISSLETSGYGNVTYKNIDAKDVTEEFLDIETRLANKRSYLERYRELLRRASTIKEVMEIEEQIRPLEEEIESAEGRLRYLGDRVSYSTLDITLEQAKDYKYIPAKGQKFWERIKRASGTGWDILKTLVLGIITLWPLLLIAAATVIAVRYFRRKKRGKNLQHRA
jgi:hypothetical protein